MKHLLITILLVFGIMKLEAQQLDLKPYRWENRIIVLIAQENGQDLLQQQTDLLHHLPSGLEERDLILFSISRKEIKGPKGPINGLDYEQLLNQFKAQKQDFTFLLIGKDGGIKLRKNALVSTEELFAIIDAMPMRRAEMRKQ